MKTRLIDERTVVVMNAKEILVFRSLAPIFKAREASHDLSDPMGMRVAHIKMQSILTLNRLDAAHSVSDASVDTLKKLDR